MRLYLCMVMGGSIFTLIYIILNRILKYGFSLKWKNIFLKTNIIFYLFPIPRIMILVKDNLKTILEKAGFVFHKCKGFQIVFSNNIWNSMIIKNKKNEVIYITGYQKLLPFIIAVSILFFVLVLGWIVTYLVINYWYKKEAVYVDSNKYLSEIYKGKRKVQIAFSPKITSPVTVGIVRPVILLPSNNEIYAVSGKGIVHHELNHILNMDEIFRFLAFLNIAMEWYNPLAYYLLRECIAVSEMLCDEAATSWMIKEEKVNYMKCIIASAEVPQKAEIVIMNFGTKKNLSKERMIKIMGKNTKKIMKNSMAFVCMLICFIVSSIPALAYKDPIEVVELDPSENNIEEWEQFDKLIIVPKDVVLDSVESMDFSLSDTVIINQAGEVFYYEETDSLRQNRKTCSHSYEAVTVFRHFLNSNGSCKVVRYNAKQCSKCENLILGSEISTNTYDPCPH